MVCFALLLLLTTFGTHAYKAPRNEQFQLDRPVENPLNLIDVLRTFGENNLYQDENTLDKGREEKLSFNYQTNLNGVFDYIMHAAKYLMAHDGDFSVPIPDIAMPFHGPVRGQFVGTSGFFRNIATLERNADAQLTFNGTTIYISASFDLKEFEAGFRNYSVEVGKISQTGEVSFQVANNSLSLCVSYDLFHPCTLNVDEISFEELEGLEVQVDGLGDFQELAVILTDWMKHSFKNTLKRLINEGLKDGVNAALQQYIHSFCKKS